MRTVLLSGCAGFIGYHLAKKLLSNSFLVVGVDNMNPYYDVQLKEKRLRILQEDSNFFFHQKDISDESIISFFTDSFDVVINLAAQAGVRHSIENPHSYTKSNLVGFANILEIARKDNSQLIYASTSSVYGSNDNQPFRESNIADHPIQYYAATKRANEIMAHSYSSMYKLKTIGLRFFTVYGPFGRPDMALFKFTKNILDDKPIQVFNNGKHVRDFTYVDDIVNGIYACIDYDFSKNLNWNAKNPSPEISNAPFRVFNLGNSNPINLLNYIEIIEELLEKKAQIEFLPLQLGDVISTESDISFAKNELGYNPTTNIRQGVINFINWYKDYYGY